MKEHVGHRDTHTGCKAGPHSGRRHPLPVQSVQEWRQECACQRAPGNPHELRNEIRRVQCQDNTDNDECHNQDLHQDKLGPVLHVLYQVALDEIQGECGTGGQYQGGQGGHGGGQHQHYHNANQDIRQPGKHGRNDCVVGNAPIAVVDGRTVKQAAEATQEIASPGYDNGKYGGDDRAGCNGLLAAYGIELMNHLRKSPGAQGRQDDNAQKVHGVWPEKGGIGAWLAHGKGHLAWNPG